jgi:hypothetical protein
MSFLQELTEFYTQSPLFGFLPPKYSEDDHRDRIRRGRSQNTQSFGLDSKYGRLLFFP